MIHIRQVLLDSNEWWKVEFELEYHERDILGNVFKGTSDHWAPTPKIQQTYQLSQPISHIYLCG